MNFKERAREEADDATQNCGEYAHLCSKWYLKGAEWGLRQAAEILRKKPYEGSWTKVKEAGQMADWLLEKAGME